ncbi:MAG: hypothetical protein IT210_18575 [Armatimonadetes bacterium]|nr:hypothetical protein [Armatimonadota bacterium]
MKGAALGLGLLLLLSRAGSGPRLERIVADYLRDALNRPEILVVRVRTEPAWGGVGGHIRVLEARATRFAVDRLRLETGALPRLAGRVDRFLVRAEALELGSLPLSRLTLDIRGLRYDLSAGLSGTIRLANRGAGAYTAELSEADLTVWARRRLGETARARLEPERLVLAATSHLGGLFPIRWEATGTLTAADGFALFWRPESATIAGVAVPAERLPFADGLRLIDVRDDLNIGLRLSLERVASGPDRLEIAGQVMLDTRR